MQKLKSLLCLGFFIASLNAFAANNGSISGTVSDTDGISLSDAQVKLIGSDGKTLKTVKSGMAGDFEFVPVEGGAYTIQVSLSSYKNQTAAVIVKDHAEVNVQLTPTGPSDGPKEITVQVKAKKHLVATGGASSTREVNQEMIASMPEGDDIKLPKLLAVTTPGIVQGPFGQTFIRGNHANIQYQIDGVQLPDSASNTFGQAFNPKNIDHMEVITGGVPAEYGERLAAVINIVTKSGSETPGGNAQLGYGAYKTLNPSVSYGGSNKAGDFHYYLSSSFSRTDRGLDTPQPLTEVQQNQGGRDAIHDSSNANDEFAKLDWQLGNSDKVDLIMYNSYSFFQIPNFPSSFKPTDPYFQAGYTDSFGNGGVPGAVTFNYTPANTNDTQAENNAYIQAVWRHAVDAQRYFQLAPYYKFSKINVTNDQANDLYAANAGAIVGSNPSSFTENRSSNNFGVKGDYTDRLDERHLMKFGFQAQDSKSSGNLSVLSQTGPTTVGGAPGALQTSSDNDPTTGYFESLYVQDEFQITKALVLNAGVRFDATQFHFSDIDTSDSWVQPRVGLSYLVTETTKIHGFVGLLFQPAPVENLRDTFQQLAGNNEHLTPYDIKAEKDIYYEVGVSQQFGQQVINLNAYYKSAKNMLDDAQVLNTSIAQPYNFAEGYAYGVELSFAGKIADNWSDFLNYSYEIAKGKGISGGLFASPQVATDYQFLDHVQVHTANGGVTYQKDRWSATAQELFGSGLRTGPNNGASLPSHLSTDTSVSYSFNGDTWISKAKLAVDVLNVFDNAYAITVANGYNGSHYSAGRELFVRLSKDL